MTRSKHYQQLFRHLLLSIELSKTRLHAQAVYHGLIDVLREATRDYLGDGSMDRTDEALREWDWDWAGKKDTATRWMLHVRACRSPREERFQRAVAATKNLDEAARNWLAPYIATVTDAHLSGDRDRERRSLARLAAESDWLKTRL